MKDLEKQIEELLQIHINSIFIAGAKSEAAKAYWQQDLLKDIESLKEGIRGYQEAIYKMYCEKEVAKLLIQCNLLTIIDGEDFDWQKWFNILKKK